MSTNITEKLRSVLGEGLGIFTPIWNYRVKNWVTSVCAADIDGDGDVEVIACSRDGRVHVLSKTGDTRWERVIGTKAWVSALTVCNLPTTGKETSTRIIVGTRDGKVYALDKDGRTITPDGQTLLFGSDGRAIDPQQEIQACWYDTEYVIRQVYVDPQRPSEIIIGSEDRCAYSIDYKTGKQNWKFQANGWVRTVCACDINRDRKAEILIGSTDTSLYLLNRQGQQLGRHDMKSPVRIIHTDDIDNDGCIEVLVATDSKDLIALVVSENQASQTLCLQEKWRRRFEDRFLALNVADLDNDGEAEIIVSSEDKHLYILDNQGKVIWQYDHKYCVFDIYPCDLDNDGLPELLIGTENEQIWAMRVRLRKGIKEKVSRYYQQLKKPDPVTIKELTNDERTLLQDITQSDKKELATFEQAQEQIRKGAYIQGLATLLKLEQQKIEPLWSKDGIGQIHTICLRHTASEARREIIVGTNKGNIYAFRTNGQKAWSTSLPDHIVDVQTGFIDQQRQEEIVICSSDHHVYILGGAQKRREAHINDTWMSSICVLAPNRHGPPEIIIGSEDKKLFIYRNDLQKPVSIIPTQEGVRIVRAHPPTGEHMPEIVAASLGNRVYAYKRDGKFLWEYKARDHIRAICIKDINNDGKVEVLIGSEDRNIHVLDNTGHLLWRYYLPHNIRAIDVADADRDSQAEVYVGCTDGYLYIFNKDGDLQWTYQARDHIRAVLVEDIDGDGNIEVAIGSADNFGLLRVVNQRQLGLVIDDCWSALQKQSSFALAIETLLSNTDPLLQVFALRKLAQQDKCSDGDFEIFAKFAAEGSMEVRKALVGMIPALYRPNAARARTLLYQLSNDNDQDVRNAPIEYLPKILLYDWEPGFQLLKRASENPDRFVRRRAIRALQRLIDSSAERSLDGSREIFGLLLSAAIDKESEWIRQEAARTLAHFLDQHYGSLVVYIHFFISKGLQPRIWQHIEHTVSNPIVKRHINNAIMTLFGLHEDNVQERLQQAVKSLQAVTNLLYGKDIQQIYIELAHLFTLQTIEEIAYYQCPLTINSFDVRNQFAHIVLPVFEKLSAISRPLKMYFMRESVPDRLASLLETIKAIDDLSKYLEQHYSVSLQGEPIVNMPDHQIFRLLLAKWNKLVLAQLNTLRGNAKLTAELVTKDACKDEQVGIWLSVRNTGRSSATDIKITLLHNEHFAIVGNNSFEREVLPPDEETTVEFTLKPGSMRLPLQFEVVYNDISMNDKVEAFEDDLTLCEYTRQFRIIPNPYSTGTPTHDSKMFYGRGQDMLFLKDNLTREARGVIVLYGQRRSGKTTLLVQLINSAILGKHIPVLIDMQRASYHMTIDKLLRRVCYYIAQAMKRKHVPITIPEPGDFVLDPIHTFDMFLDTIEEQLGGHQLILMIDEFEVLEEQVMKGNLQPEIFEYLRNMVQSRQSVNFLFSGTHKITEYTKWYSSVFFNIAIHHRLSRITAQGAEDLIQKPVEGFLEYEATALKKIRQLTADQPYLIHLICRAIVDFCNDRHKTFVTINDVNTVLQRVMATGQFYFDWLWDQIKPEVRVTLAAIAEGGREEGRWLQFNEIEGIYLSYRIPYKYEYILDALKTLIEADIIEDEPGDARKNTLNSYRFRIAVGLIRGWLLKEHPLELVRKEMHG